MQSRPRGAGPRSESYLETVGLWISPVASSRSCHEFARKGDVPPAVARDDPPGDYAASTFFGALALSQRYGKLRLRSTPRPFCLVSAATPSGFRPGMTRRATPGMGVVLGRARARLRSRLARRRECSQRRASREPRVGRRSRTRGSVVRASDDRSGTTDARAPTRGRGESRRAASCVRCCRSRLRSKRRPRRCTPARPAALLLSQQTCQGQPA